MASLFPLVLSAPTLSSISHTHDSKGVHKVRLPSLELPNIYLDGKYLDSGDSYHCMYSLNTQSSYHLEYPISYQVEKSDNDHANHDSYCPHGNIYQYANHYYATEAYQYPSHFYPSKEYYFYYNYGKSSPMSFDDTFKASQRYKQKAISKKDEDTHDDLVQTKKETLSHGTSSDNIVIPDDGGDFGRFRIGVPQDHEFFKDKNVLTFNRVSDSGRKFWEKFSRCELELDELFPEEIVYTHLYQLEKVADFFKGKYEYVYFSKANVYLRNPYYVLANMDFKDWAAGKWYSELGISTSEEETVSKTSLFKSGDILTSFDESGHFEKAKDTRVVPTTASLNTPLEMSQLYVDYGNRVIFQSDNINDDFDCDESDLNFASKIGFLDLGEMRKQGLNMGPKGTKNAKLTDTYITKPLPVDSLKESELYNDSETSSEELQSDKMFTYPLNQIRLPNRKRNIDIKFDDDGEFDNYNEYYTSSWGNMVPLAQYIASNSRESKNSRASENNNPTLHKFSSDLDAKIVEPEIGVASSPHIEPRSNLNQTMKKPSHLYGSRIKKLESPKPSSDVYGFTTAQIFSQRDIIYIVQIKIGDEDEPYSLLIDTGSFHTWVYSSACAGPECNSFRKYNKTTNSDIGIFNLQQNTPAMMDDRAKHHTTGSNTLGVFAVVYSTGQVNGTIIRDRVRFAGFDSLQYFGLADWVGPVFSQFKIDGILAMPASDRAPVSLKEIDSGSSGATSQFPCFINTLHTQGLINRRIFGIDLSRSRDRSESQRSLGSLTVGGIDHSKFKGTLSYSPVVSSLGYWEVVIESVDVNGNKVVFKQGNYDEASLNPSNSDQKNLLNRLKNTYGGVYPLTRDARLQTGILDTGTSLLVLNIDDAMTLHSFIPNVLTDGENYAIPCDTSVDIGFTIAGTRWSISPKDYVGGPYIFNNMPNGGNLDPKSGIKYCRSNIGGVQMGSGFWVLGEVFLRNVYSVYDMDRQAVGLAAKKRLTELEITPDSVYVYHEKNGKGIAYKRKPIKSKNINDDLDEIIRDKSTIPIKAKKIGKEMKPLSLKNGVPTMEATNTGLFEMTEIHVVSDAMSNQGFILSMFSCVFLRSVLLIVFVIFI